MYALQFFISVNYVLSGYRNSLGGFPGGAVVKNVPCSARDTGPSLDPGRSHTPGAN